ncbi:MAG: FAD-dependent oxidoreductase [Deltaproteobacteria bacterium]|nr:FAD-dependent oxidoreductase [Deltaproteobacteria bacterium]
MTNASIKGQKIIEPSNEINVFKEAEVVVIGGGPAGVSAAVASARNGADAILIERYGLV